MDSEGDRSRQPGMTSDMRQLWPRSRARDKTTTGARARSPDTDGTRACGTRRPHSHPWHRDYTFCEPPESVTGYLPPSDHKRRAKQCRRKKNKRHRTQNPTRNWKRAGAYPYTQARQRCASTLELTRRKPGAHALR
eukprot:2579487-Rhodomonas_salina.1